MPFPNPLTFLSTVTATKLLVSLDMVTLVSPHTPPQTPSRGAASGGVRWSWCAGAESGSWMSLRGGGGSACCGRDW